MAFSYACRRGGIARGPGGARRMPGMPDLFHGDDREELFSHEDLVDLFDANLSPENKSSRS
jgi:hypothetical protein